MAWPSAKTLGGSSILNCMMYLRGTVEGFDAIANETRDSIWSLRNVLKYYERIENYEGFVADSTCISVW